MACKWLGSIATLLAGAGLAWGQTATQPLPPPSTLPAVQTPSTTPVPPPSAAIPPPILPHPGDTIVAPADENPSNGCWYLSQSDVDHSRVWFQTEYLLWWLRPGSMPPVIGTAPTNLVATGSLPSDSITPLFGGGSNALDYDKQSGVRVSLGYWFDNCQEWGIEGSFFQLEQKTISGRFASPGDPVLGPVFFDPTTNTRNLILASLPNFTTGSFAGLARSGVVEANTNNRLWGAELNIRKQIGAVFFADHLDLLVGFRHLQFSEGADIITDSESLPGSAPATLHIEDHLGALNQFYGPQIGLASHTQLGRWSVDLIGKLALGDMHEVNNISGSTLLTTPGTTIVSATGVLAEPTNIGQRTTDRFAVIPELTLNFGFQVIDNVRLTAGYNFLYISNVMRAGDLVDGVDARQVRSLSTFDATAPMTHPVVVQHDTRFWAQGINFGIEVRY